MGVSDFGLEKGLMKEEIDWNEGSSGAAGSQPVETTNPGRRNRKGKPSWADVLIMGTDKEPMKEGKETEPKQEEGGEEQEWWHKHWNESGQSWTDWWSAREAEWKEWEEEQKEEAEEEAARQLEETKKEGTEKKEEKRNWWESTASKEEQERRWAKTWLVKEPGKGSTETPEAPTEAPVEGPKKNKCGSEKQKAKLKWVEGQAKEKGASDQELELMRLGALWKSRADRLVRRQVDRQKALKVAELAEESASKAAEAAQATAYMAEMQQWHHWQQLQAQAWHWQAYTYEGQGHQSTGLLLDKRYCFNSLIFINVFHSFQEQLPAPQLVMAQDCLQDHLLLFCFSILCPWLVRRTLAQVKGPTTKELGGQQLSTQTEEGKEEKGRASGQMRSFCNSLGLAKGL